MENKNIPYLRFSEFNEDWKNVNFKDIAFFLKGKGIAKSDISEGGSLECIRYGELYTFYGETIKHVKSRTNVDRNLLVLSEQNDVIIPASGETQMDIATASCVIRDGIALGGDLNIIRSSSNGVFLSYYLNNKKKREIASLAQGVSVVHLYASQLKTLQLNLPNSFEQLKIATFLASVDNKIQLLKKKKTLLEEYKKGVMDSIFSQKIRFRDDYGNYYPHWKDVSLGEVCKIKSGNSPNKYKLNNEGNYPFLKVEELNNCSKYQMKSREYTNDSSFLIPEKSIIFPKRGAAILNNKVRINLEKVIIDSNLMSLNAFPDLMYYEFLYYLIIFIKLFKIADTSSIPQINNKHIIPYLIQSPIIEEQIKIANFLSALDEKIDLLNKQIDNTLKYKKGLLQQMFV